MTDNSLILVAEGLEKPGNLGAILRTADAACLDAVLIANPKSDVYNPNVIRTSIGCIFTNKIAIGTTDEIVAFLRKHNIRVYCAALQEAEPYYTKDYTQPTAIVVGTEATGVTHEFRQHSDANV